MAGAENPTAIDINTIVQLVTVLAPLVAPTVASITGALKGAGALTDAQITEEFTALVVEAGIAKAMADKAAAGADPQ